MSDLEQALLREQLQWYRLQRHDFLNHWQVIMGYLQLNQGEKALTYMQDALTGLEEEQKIAHILEPQLAAILLSFLIGLRLEGVAVTLDFPDEMKGELYWETHWRKEYAEAFYGYTRTWLEKASLYVGLQQKTLNALMGEIYLFSEPGGLAGQFILSNDDETLFEKMVTLSDSEIKCPSL